MLDTVFRNGILIDGTGAPRRAADVGVLDGRVVAVGEVEDSASRTVDLDGLVLAPGFVDIHTHYDVQAFWDTTLSPSPLHGVTFVSGGNCGFAVAPVADQESANYLMRLLSHVEAMPLATLEQGVPWDWRTTAEFLDAVDRGLSINAGFMVGHSALRCMAMGEAALERHATDAEVAVMCDLLRAGLAAGGLGFSSSWSETHNDDIGRPVPSRFASADELITLARVCRDFPGTSVEFDPAVNGPQTAEHERVLVEMSLASQRPVNWNVLFVDAANLVKSRKAMHAGTLAKERGAKVVGMVMSGPSPLRFNFLGAFVLEIIPGWADAMALPAREKLEFLRSENGRRELVAATQAEAAQPYKEFFKWDQYKIFQTFTPETEKYAGRLLRDIAQEEGKDSFNALLDIVCADGLRTVFGDQEPNDSRADWEARAELWRDERMIIAGSDAGAHLDMICSFNYTTMLLEDGVRNQGLLSLEEAVRQITKVPADLYGLVGRGVIEEGSAADLVVFDPDTVGPERLDMVFDLPAGAGRLFAGAKGIHNVFVSGEEVVTSGKFTEARPGRVLRSGKDTVTPSMQY
jgi:N-acyl-D-aspartate/D-glutamate deacylase